MRTPSKAKKNTLAGRLARPRTGLHRGAGADPQLDQLSAAGCANILEEHASSADRGRPFVLAHLHATSAPAKR
jgi:hypothetical protein